MATWYAKSLQEYTQIINEISQQQGQRKHPLWFRGLEQTGTQYYLEPGIFRNFRNGEWNSFNNNDTYGTLWLKEEYRYQHFAARNYDKIQAMPESFIEWQEIMQHYFSKTRLMDWSESAIVALSFALEAYINPVEDKEVAYKRRYNAPVVWVLNPVMLNGAVYQCFKNNPGLIKKAMSGMKSGVIYKTIDEIKFHEDLYFRLEDKFNGGVNGLISLSGLELLRQSHGTRLQEAVEDGNFNPFFYLLLRYYSDGIAIKTDDLPPLAIIHPHHSPRIHEQKGAFTIFPYYKSDNTKQRISPFAMEYMNVCKPCLDKIIVMDAWSMSEQLREIGVKRSHLYPEMEIIAKDFEYIK